MLRKMGRASAHRCRSLICDADQPFQPAFKNNRSHSLSFRPPPLAGQALPPLGLGVGRYAPSPALSPPGLPLPSVGLASARKGKPKRCLLALVGGGASPSVPLRPLLPPQKMGRVPSVRRLPRARSIRSAISVSRRLVVGFASGVRSSDCLRLAKHSSSSPKSICHHQGLNLPPLCGRSARAPLRPRLAPLVRLAHSKSALRA
jgi:hypothetical protein